MSFARPSFSALPKHLALLTLLASPAALSAQELPPLEGNVTDDRPMAAMTEGPEVEGIISGRRGTEMQVTQADGTKPVIAINDATKISASGGFLGLDRDRLAATQLYNGVPVKVETMQAGGMLVASKISLKSRDLKTAEMIFNGTDQRFVANEAATEALRGRMGDIDKYNIKSTTNVNFDTGKSVLSDQAKADLCAAAQTAEAQENALLLVVGYTDSTGPEEVNQKLSEARAGRVTAYLQQVCKWKSYRMLAPAAMAAYDPVASNDTDEGRAINRRVAVNVLVSKAVDGF